MSELEVADLIRKDITILPLRSNTVKREIPHGIKVDTSLCSLPIYKKVLSFWGIVRFFPLLKSQELRIHFNIRGVFNFFKYLYASSITYNDVVQRVDNQNNDVYYSYWMSYTPIAFALYKHKHPDTKNLFIARGHGSDIYGERLDIYYPLRDFIFHEIDHFFIISNQGAQYLINKYPFAKERISVSRLGVFSNINNDKAFKENRIRFVSCSSVIPLKRVDLIFESINKYANNHLDCFFEWIHIGDGPLLDMIKSKVSIDKARNLNCVFKGLMDNKEILRLYKREVFHVFVLLSSSEGIPVSIMEAISSGIPVIATNVGGVSEIVSSKTGQLLPQDFTQHEFSKAVDTVLLNNKELSESAYEFFSQNYEANINYQRFYTELDKFNCK